MAYLLKKRRSALPTPRETGRMTMATFLLSSVKSCEGGHGLCHHLREEGHCPSSPKKERVMTMVIFFHTSVESSGGDRGISSREGSGLLVLKWKGVSSLLVLRVKGA